MPWSVVANFAKFNYWLAALAVLATALVATALAGQPVSADDSGASQVNLQVNGSTAPDLKVDSVSTSISSVPLQITGQVSNLTQVQVFIDGVMTSVIPLTVTDTTFSYSLSTRPGTYTLKFIGISAYTSTNPEIELTITYHPEQGDDSKSGSSSPTSKSSPGVSINSQGDHVEVGSGQSEATSKKPLNLPRWLVRVLVPLDIINPAQTERTPQTIWRIIGLIIGLVAVTLPRLLIWLYARLWHRQATISHRPEAWIRLVGSLLLVAVFIFI